MEIINKDNQINFKDINGRRTLSRNGETLVEGVHFLVDGEYDHLHLTRIMPLSVMLINSVMDI